MTEPAPAPDPTAADVVRTAARAHERDRYLAALLAPRRIRADLIALAAFAGEMARIPGWVEDPMAGEIRFQWWREVLGLAEERRDAGGHPIAVAVKRAMVEYGLPPALLGGLIDAHATLLWDETPADEQDMRAHLAKTQGALFALFWRVAGGAERGGEPIALSEAGQAYGLARLLLEFPVDLAQQRVLIPKTRLDDAGLALGNLTAGVGLDRMDAVLADLRADARRRARAVIADLKQADTPTRLALLPVALIEPYLRAQEEARDIRVVADISPLTRVWRLWRAHRLGIY